MKRVTEQEYKDIKKYKYMPIYLLKRLSKRSCTTIMRVRLTKNYREYRDLCEIQHPAVKNSLKDKIHQLYVMLYSEHPNLMVEESANNRLDQIIRDIQGDIKNEKRIDY